ncbi:MAG TPA: bifunctional DNA-binding transcriptional regulator/O6-methylguanine-DNA methyltransferase Ada [Longimicrobiaceae bacterium]
MQQAIAQSPSLPDEAVCWQAVLERDRAYDGKFVYAVRTTGIFCRPSCPARRPKRGSVRFFTPADAIRAGFRPCRRCRPLRPEGAPTDEAVRRAIEFIESHLDEHVTLERLAREVGISPYHLQRIFKNRLGLTPHAYQKARRLERFKEVARSGYGVGRATYEAGFNSSRCLYESAIAGMGMTPGRYRRGGVGLEIRFTVIDSPLGRLLVGATDRGVCAVSLGEEDDALERALRDEFPGARLLRDEESLRAWAEAVARRVVGEDPGLAVPVDLRGTVFQLRVWDALRRIPAGETRTYAEVAEAVGSPGAARAVGSACALNPVALLVPCHRVVRADGSPGDYRWGRSRKERLLRAESEKRGSA